MWSTERNATTVYVARIGTCDNSVQKFTENLLCAQHCEGFKMRRKHSCSQKTFSLARERRRNREAMVAVTNSPKEGEREGEIEIEDGRSEEAIDRTALKLTLDTRSFGRGRRKSEMSAGVYTSEGC